ncbi:TPA: molecular chaperone [Vibrio metschnikovii]
MRTYINILILIINVFFSSTYVVAGISLDTTRIIFTTENERQGLSVGISSSKQSIVPYLVKAQVLSDIEGSNSDVPFIVTPSLFRLEPGSTNQVRIVKIDKDLPIDKESIFYFRTTAIPAGDKNSSEFQTVVGGALSVSTGSIIKLFYRPNGLPITQKQAMANLVFSYENNHIEVKNPTPYFITLSKLIIDDVKVPLNLKNTMIEPYSSQIYLVDVSKLGSIEWQAINDYGAKEIFYGTFK